MVQMHCTPDKMMIIIFLLHDFVTCCPLLHSLVKSLACKPTKHVMHVKHSLGLMGMRDQDTANLI